MFPHFFPTLFSTLLLSIKWYKIPMKLKKHHVFSSSLWRETKGEDSDGTNHHSHVKDTFDELC